VVKDLWGEIGISKSTQDARFTVEAELLEILEVGD